MIDRFEKRFSHLAPSVWVVSIAFGLWLFLLYLVVNYIAYSIGVWFVADYEATSLTALKWVEHPVESALLALHLSTAMAIYLVGPLQLVPRIRKKHIGLHRALGRIFVYGAALSSLTGFYMVWVRGHPQAGLLEHIGTSIGGALTLAFCVLTVRGARKRDLASHQRCALRLFALVIGALYIRIGYGFWLAFGSDDAGAFLRFSIFISYAQYLLPLGALEGYFFLRSRNSPTAKAAGLVIPLAASVAQLVGIYFAARYLWWPELIS